MASAMQAEPRPADRRHEPRPVATHRRCMATGLASYGRSSVSRRSQRQPRKGRAPGWSRWWLAGAGVLAAAVILALGFVARRGQSTVNADEVGCSTMEQLAYHIH